MKRYVILFILLLLCISVKADRRKMLLQASTRLASTTLLLKENFDVTGFENTSPNAWVTVNNVDPDDILSVVNGTNDCAVYRVTSTATATLYWIDIGPGTNLSHYSAFFAMKTSATNLTGSCFAFTTNGTISHLLQIRNTGRLRFYDSASTLFASPVDGYPQDTINYVWLDVDEIAGVATVEFSATDQKLGSGNKYASLSWTPNGVMANQVQLLSSVALQTNSFDYLRAWTNALPSSPQ